MQKKHHLPEVQVMGGERRENIGYGFIKKNC
jgi:hypothetical protein